MRLILVLMGAALMLCAACGGDGDSGGDGDERPGAGELAAVASVPEFAQEFDRAKGHPRLVLLLSPT